MFRKRLCLFDLPAVFSFSIRPSGGSDKYPVRFFDDFSLFSLYHVGQYFGNKNNCTMGALRWNLGRWVRLG